MAYSGRYKVKNASKYEGDHTQVYYRSMWEKYCMMFFDKDKRIKKWSSEEIIIPYLYEADKKYHRYYPDFKVTWASGNVSLIEVKPNKETKPPTGNRRTKRYINEGFTYVKNVNKWEAAAEYCKDRNWHFEIWTEVELEAMGIKPKSTKRLAPYSRKKAK